ncbi:MAG TPA: LamG-like jellyroll fold domain-containing protein [Chthonomonadales bacterium]|nr:LamG-like jellyroll fold domain-containing protein [Chthonomonadales bacterium]
MHLRPLVLAVLPAVAAVALSAPAMAREYHVSPRGRDSNPGTRASPFATLERAREAVRAARRAAPRGAVTVWLRGGVYTLERPLVLGREDSGVQGAPVTWAAWPGESPLVSGGVRVTGWRREAGGLLSAPAPLGLFFRQLWVNDRRATRARWPNENGRLRITSVTDDVMRFGLSEPIPGGPLAGQHAELVVYQHWSVTRGLVTASGEREVTTATPMGWIGHGAMTTTSPGKPCFLEHARAFLDQPGEWFLDRAAGRLLYKPLRGERPETLNAVAPRLEQLLRVEGVKGEPVRHLTFRGLRFAHTEFPLPAFGYREIQAGHFGTTTGEPTWVQPVAIEISHAEDIRFEGCTVSATSASGIGFGPGTRRCVVSRCTIRDIGGNGVMVGWRGKGELQGGAARPLDADWADPADAPRDIEVADSVFERCGAFSEGCVGIFVAFSEGTRIVRNHVHTMPYTGVSIGYRWNTTPTTQKRCLVEGNHIHDVMLLLADGGGIYSLGFQPGTVLRGNHIHDVHRSAFAHGGAPNNGFFVDEGSKGFLFERNLVYRTSGEPVRFNNCLREWHTWRDNLFGGVALPVPGRFGSALACGGRGSLEVPHAPELEPAHLTLEAWVRPETVHPPGEDGRRWVVGKNANEWAEGHYALVTDGAKAGAYLNIGGGPDNATLVWSPEGALRPGVWTHLAATYDGELLRLLVGGRLVASARVGRPRTAGTGPFVIGRRPDAGFGFGGAIDEVRLTARAMDEREIAASARARGRRPPEPAGLVRAWSFDDLTGLPAQVLAIAREAGPEPEGQRAIGAGAP